MQRNRPLRTVAGERGLYFLFGKIPRDISRSALGADASFRIVRGKCGKTLLHASSGRRLAMTPLRFANPCQLATAKVGSDADRDRIIRTLGNLMLLTKKLNSKVSNEPWLGSEGKREGPETNDVLMLNRQLLDKAGKDWTDDAIRVRTLELARLITQIWPVPPNHRSAVTTARPRLRKKIDLSDLITGGALEPVGTLSSAGEVQPSGCYTAPRRPIRSQWHCVPAGEERQTQWIGPADGRSGGASYRREPGATREGVCSTLYI